MVDVRKIDEDGLTVCSQCTKHYKPVLGERPQGDNRSIQKIFPNATPEEREQLVTGFCTTKCWNRYLGV